MRIMPSPAALAILSAAVVSMPLCARHALAGATPEKSVNVPH